MQAETRLSAQLESDLPVIGSGAGGLSAAVTAAWHGLKVIVAEKEPEFGGTTAWSGGWMWAPLNPLAKRAGVNEAPETPRAYLREVLGNNFDDARVNAFLEATRRMVTFYEKNTALPFEGGTKIADTYGNAPGAGVGGRSVITAPYDARDRPAWPPSTVER
jgi:succinate dehydrogenase/fumarate reductase flavoprotein subunit